MLHRGLAIDELWFLTHPHVKKGGIGCNEHEKALSRDRRLLRHFNKTENDEGNHPQQEDRAAAAADPLPRRGRCTAARASRLPLAVTPAPGTAAATLGGGDTGGGTTSAPSGPPPIPPPPMPAWMVAAGLGGTARRHGRVHVPGATVAGGMA